MQYVHEITSDLEYELNKCLLEGFLAFLTPYLAVEITAITKKYKL